MATIYDKGHTTGRQVGAAEYNYGVSNGIQTRTYAENKSSEIEIVGKYSDLLVKQPTAGDSVPAEYVGYLPSADSGFSWKCQNSALSREDGGMGHMRISCVQVDANGAYDISWDIDMQEVNRSLKQHPKIIASSGALEQIKMWEATPEAVRTYNSGGTLKFRYYNTTSAQLQGQLVDVTNDEAEDYMKAFTSGIETYNVYLPVVTKTSRYLTTISGTGGTIPYSDKIGRFDTPSYIPAGYSGTNKWFKSCDKYSRANNGTWNRTEQWTYTDDTSHTWIYAELS